ncbi:hypothetical protein JG688_00009692 [Phytophthora aleatoria]|uniref:ZSWIM1/3 RNaseH-like domain-containing protein n=1 Tax=Phytophthora aleatoria TaxID=2496075 RepID=A0A8J5M6H3_9STRA|nr:hypothetical protein JG688_00009692 [Phytophthora aleatoria]
MQARPGTSSIYEYIRENSDHRVTMAHVCNLMTRLQSSYVRLSDDDAVAETIVNVNLESTKNVSTVHQREQANTGVISVTIAHMRSILESLPEVVQLDCTHKINR